MSKNSSRNRIVALFSAFVVAGACTVASAQQEFNQQNNNNRRQQQEYNQGNQGNQNYNQDPNQQGFGGGRRGRQQFDQQGGGGRGNGRNRFQQQFAVTNSGEFTADYGVVSDKNIFLRDRRVRLPNEDQGIRTPPPPPIPEQLHVVTGIIFDVDTKIYKAQIENTGMHTADKLKIGDKVAEGEIADITLNPDGIKYRKGGQDTWVPIGSNLMGTQIGNMGDERARGAMMGGQFIMRSGGGVVVGGQSGAPLPPLDPNTAGMSMEERLRARRMAESQGVTVIVQPSPDAVPAAPPPPPADPNSIEERLRLRRLQEQGR